MISKEEADAMQQARIACERELEETVDVGLASVEGLAHQEQQLTHSEKNLIHQEYLLAKSRRTLRGMTWSGWVANMVTNEPPPPQEMTNFPSSQNYKTKLHHEKYQEQQTLPQNKITSNDPTIAAQLKAQDDHINGILKNISKLSEVGNIISESVSTSNAQLDILDDHTEEINDETRAIIRMQGRLHRSVRGKPVFLYHVVIEHVESGKLLYVSESGYPELLEYVPSYRNQDNTNIARGNNNRNDSGNGSNKDSRNKSDIPVSARWELFQRPDEVIAFKSCATQTFLGQNLLGYIKVRGSKFGNWESFEFNLMKNCGPLLCCSANSNGGGWVHLTPGGNGTTAPAPSQHQAQVASIPGGGGGGGYSSSGSSFFGVSNSQSSSNSSDLPLRLEAKSDTLSDKRLAPTWHVHHIQGPTVPLELKLKHDEVYKKSAVEVSPKLNGSSGCAFDV